MNCSFTVTIDMITHVFYCRQIAVDVLLRVLFDTKPADAFCVIGVTMMDLYEGADDSFVVGMAK